MKYIITIFFILTFTGCATQRYTKPKTRLVYKEKPVVIKNKATRFEECAERFIKLTVEPLDAMEICKSAHGVE